MRRRIKASNEKASSSTASSSNGLGSEGLNAIGRSFLWLVALLGCCCAIGCAPSNPIDAAIRISNHAAPTDEQAIRQFCGDCHALPRSSSFARARWRHEVEQGFRLYASSGRDDLVAPDFDATLAFFERDAPGELVLPILPRKADTQFKLAKQAWTGARPPVAIAQALVLESNAGKSDLAIVDLYSGGIFLSELGPDGFQSNLVADLSHPSHIERVDMNGDGLDDFVVADLGTIRPEGQFQASLWLLEASSDGSYKPTMIRGGMLRASDVRPLDYDNDGDTDLLIADFGMHFDGGIYVGLNQGTKDDRPQFEWKVVDSRPGAIEMPIMDFDGDGNTDIITLVAQHYETLEIHFGNGSGQYDVKRVYETLDPSYGTSGVEVVDFDNDGDLDFVYTNGDTFDDGMAKPYHGVHWLENQGSFPFKHHQIATMPAVYCAVVGDIDLDGDLDVAATALVGEGERKKHPVGSMTAIVWLENSGTGQFTMHEIADAPCNSATCNLMDVDGDGDLDLFAPPHSMLGEPSPELLVYFNQAR